MTKWVATTDRKPTRADACEMGHVWGFSLDGEVVLVPWFLMDGAIYPYWMPREERPAPKLPPAIQGKIAARRAVRRNSEERER